MPVHFPTIRDNMKKAPFFVGLVLLLWGTSVVFAQSDCMPCGPLCSSDGVFGSPFSFGGWIETGIYTNGNGGGDNGPMHAEGRRRTDFMMSQLYFFGEKELDTKRGFGWGGRADLVYGVDKDLMQTYGDETFDFDWGTNRHGYGMSAYQLYGTLGYKDLSVMIGKFITPVGWESPAAKENFFYSHSYCYWIEPSTHTGVLATYDMTDRLSVNAGWTTGMDSSFSNPNSNKAVLAGLTYSLTKNATVHYWINKGKQRFDLDADTRTDYFVQSVCLEWIPSDRFTYVLQYNLRNDNEAGGGRTSAYGINNHFLYTLSDRWGVGTRFEWLRDNGGYIVDDAGDYYQVTFGFNWNPYENVSIRPEVRYDWCNGGTPFGKDETHKDQVTGGFGVVVSF